MSSIFPSLGYLVSTTDSSGSSSGQTWPLELPLLPLTGGGMSWWCHQALQPIPVGSKKPSKEVQRSTTNASLTKNKTSFYITGVLFLFCRMFTFASFDLQLFEFWWPQSQLLLKMEHIEQFFNRKQYAQQKIDQFCQIPTNWPVSMFLPGFKKLLRGSKTIDLA